MDAELKLMIQSEVEINLIPQIVTMTSVCNEPCVVVSIIRLSTELNWPIYRITMWVVPQSTINPSLVIFLTDKRRINNPLVCFISFLTYFLATFILVLFSLSLHIFFPFTYFVFFILFYFSFFEFSFSSIANTRMKKRRTSVCSFESLYFLSPLFSMKCFLAVRSILKT